GHLDVFLAFFETPSLKSTHFAKHNLVHYLHLAIEWNHPDIMSWLINKAAVDPFAHSAVCAETAEMPLWHAARVPLTNCLIPLLELLVSAQGAKAVAALRDEDGRTPLHVAVARYQNHDEVLADLLEFGYKLDARDGEGRSVM